MAEYDIDRAIHRYANWFPGGGFAGGFVDPLGDRSSREPDVILIKSEAAVVADIPGEYWRGNPRRYMEGLRQAQIYANQSGYESGYLTHEYSHLKSGVVFLRPGYSERTSVSFGELSGSRSSIWLALNKKTREFVAENKDKYLKAFPLGVSESEDENRLGLLLIKSNAGVRERVQSFKFVHLTEFDYDFENIGADRVSQIMQHLAVIVTRIETCKVLEREEKDRLMEAFLRRIRITISNDPTANASVPFGQNVIQINFANLWDAGDDEIRQTLIHEMMHIAGYCHPIRCDSIEECRSNCSLVRDPRCPPEDENLDCNRVDTPLQGGPYYNSAPLRAELCIAGGQSLVAKHERIRCNPTEEGYSIVRLR